MPVETTKYLCQFKCGKKCVSNKKAMETHESTCWKNPSVKSCSTCKHEIYEHDGCDHPELAGCPSEEWMNRSCKKVESSLFDKMMNMKHYRPYEKPENFHIYPIVGCPFWEAKLSERNAEKGTKSVEREKHCI